MFQVGTLEMGGTTVIDASRNITAGHISQTEIFRPNVSWGNSGTSTGQIAIRLPDSISQYDMVNIEIDVYEYSGSAGTKIYVSGHNYNSSIGWHN